MFFVKLLDKYLLIISKTLHMLSQLVCMLSECLPSYNLALMQLY